MRWLLSLVIGLVSTQSLAAGAAAFPSCYDAKVPALTSAIEAEIFLLIDQTTLFDDRLKQSIADNVRPFLKAGNAFSVTQFSAFTQGHYTDVLVSGKLDPLLPKEARDNVSKTALAKFDQCTANQPRLAGQMVGNAMRSAFGGSSDQIAQSDILASLKDISQKVRQSTATRKIILIASDMLENSSVTSFYAKGGVRQINPEKELKLVTENQLFGDFAGAKIYVIGAGLLPEDSKHADKKLYRTAQVMQALATFWTTYFQRSKGELVEFGQPALLNPVR